MIFFNTLLVTILPFFVLGSDRESRVSQQWACGRACMRDCRSFGITCSMAGFDPVEEFFKLNGCIYSEVYRSDSSKAQKCKNCIDAHLDLLMPEEVLSCLGQGISNGDTCSNLQTQQACKKEKTVQCGWLSGKCHSVEQELTYDLYNSILRDTQDLQLCAKLGGTVRKGSHCVARQMQNVRCTAINKFGRKRSRCDDCEILCDWLDGCEYKSNKNTCTGQKPFLTL